MLFHSFYELYFPLKIHLQCTTLVLCVYALLHLFFSLKMDKVLDHGLTGRLASSNMEHLLSRGQPKAVYVLCV